jgi:putative PepSY-like beta-lactamase-inhibitor
MKIHQIFSLILFLLLSSCSTSQTKPDVPELILTRFKALYPNAGKTVWEPENDKYEASFKSNGKEVTIVFAQDGGVEQTETEVETAALPPAVSEYVTKSLEGKKIEEAVKIVDAYGATTWEIEVGKQDYLFASNGEFIGMEPEEPGDTEEDD